MQRGDKLRGRPSFGQHVGMEDIGAVILVSDGQVFALVVCGCAVHCWLTCITCFHALSILNEFAGPAGRETSSGILIADIQHRYPRMSG